MDSNYISYSLRNNEEMILGIFLVLLGKELLIMDVFLLPPADYFAGQEGQHLIH